MKRAGQIVLFRFPRTDLGEGKLRPALLLGRLPGEYDDWLIWWRSDNATVSASLTAFLSPATLRRSSSRAKPRGSGQASLLTLDDDVLGPKVVIHVYAHLVGRQIADVSHGGSHGVVFAEKVAEGSRFSRTLHDD
jgi:hypothetical protein